MEQMSVNSTSRQDSQDHVVVAHWLCGAEKGWQFLAQDLSCFLPLAHQWHWLHHLSRIADQWQLLHWQCHVITWCWSAVWFCNSVANLWTIKIKSLYMLWSQYKLAWIKCTEFLHKQITRILNFTNRNSNFLTLQTLEFLKNPTGIFGIKNEIRIPFTMGVPEIGTKNWNSQPSQWLRYHICHRRAAPLSLWLLTDDGNVGNGGMTRMTAMAMAMVMVS